MTVGELMIKLLGIEKVNTRVVIGFYSQELSNYAKLVGGCLVEGCVEFIHDQNVEVHESYLIEKVFVIR